LRVVEALHLLQLSFIGHACCLKHFQQRFVAQSSSLPQRCRELGAVRLDERVDGGGGVHLGVRAWGGHDGGKGCSLGKGWSNGEDRAEGDGGLSGALDVAFFGWLAQGRIFAVKKTLRNALG
jgi:hypothetical protein